MKIKKNVEKIVKFGIKISVVIYIFMCKGNDFISIKQYHKYGNFILCLVKCLCDILESVVDMLYTDREADCCRSDVLLCKFLWRQL